MKGNLLGTILKILSTVLIVVNSVLSIGTAYIVFAPDDFPKPFYLVYAYDDGAQYPATVEGSNPSGGQTTGDSHGTTSTKTTSTSKTTPAPESPAAGSVTPGTGIMVPMGAQIINLAEPTGKRYVRVSVVLEFAPEVDLSKVSAEVKTEKLAEFNTAIETKKALINDIIITTISVKTYQQLYTSEGKEALRQEILTKVNEKLKGYHVIAVYFSEFVVD